MKLSRTVWTIVALAVLIGPTSAWWGAGAAAQMGNASIVGDVKDKDGKPFPDVTVVITNDQGRKWTLKTDAKGHFSQGMLLSGVYTVAYQIKDQTIWDTKVTVQSGQETRADANFKELIAKQGAEAAEAVKKQEEEKAKFETMKTHFEAGVAAADLAKQVRGEVQRAPADQRATLQAKLDDLYGTAINELQAAEKTTPEKDANHHIVLARLGDTLEAAGKYPEAADAYQKAIALKGDVPGYYNNLGNSLAKAGKMDEAMAAYQKCAAMDPANAANAWRNAGIVLYNAGKSKEAVEPLKKAAELEPKNPQTWYLLGASLVGAMGYKQEGGKIIPLLLPGTVEAYQKALDLDPNGPYGVQAKQGLEQLQQMGLGIDIKVKARPTKK